MDTILRTQKIQNFLSEATAAIITSSSNRFYLTGFNSSAGTVFITKNKAYFLIDFRYFEKAKQTVKSCETVLLEELNKQLNLLCKEHNISEILIETENVSISEFNKYKEKLPCEISQDSALNKLILDMRSIKTKNELENIKAAQALTEQTFNYILPRIETGRSEKEITLDMEFYMRKLGSRGVAFDFIVVSGKNSSLPHGVPTDKKLEKGDFITMDFGAVVNGYRSDMTRTVAIGSVTEKQKLVYDTVLKAQLAAIREIKAGELCSNIDKIARDIIYSAGFAGCFGHGLGHSVGIDIHESPSLSPKCNTVLNSGMIMTVEPGIYIENEFGVRIEDMVYITDTDSINLTSAKKELLIL